MKGAMRGMVLLFGVIFISCSSKQGIERLSPAAKLLVPYIQKGFEVVADYRYPDGNGPVQLPPFGDGMVMPSDPLGHPLKFRRWPNGEYAVCADAVQIDKDLKGLYFCGTDSGEGTGAATIEFREDTAVELPLPPSFDAFKRLSLGMSHEKVVEIFGEPGRELWATHSETYDTVKYRWGTPFRNAEVVFEKNEVTSYEQIGLD